MKEFLALLTISPRIAGLKIYLIREDFILRLFFEKRAFPYAY
jgi:hypothetical protein